MTLIRTTGSIFACAILALMLSASCAGLRSGAGYYEGKDQLSEQDRITQNAALQRAMDQARIGRREEWSNPATGNSGAIIVTGVNAHTMTYQGRVQTLPARTYTEEVKVNGQTRVNPNRGAVRLPEGRWFRYQ